MVENHAVQKALDLIDKYLAGTLPAFELVRAIDNLVADDYLAELDPPFRKLVSEFQDELALLVSGKEACKEAPGVYFCEDELPPKARETAKNIQAALNSISN